MKLITYDKKFGILYKGSIFDINTFEKVETEKYSLIHSKQLQNLPNKDLDKEFLKALRRRFTYTKIGTTTAFHINLTQKFFVKINKDNTMNIYSGYPVFILKRLLKFIEQNVVPQNYFHSLYCAISYLLCSSVRSALWSMEVH